MPIHRAVEMLQEAWFDLTTSAWKCQAQNNYQIRFYNLMYNEAESIYRNAEYLDSDMEYRVAQARAVSMPEADDDDYYA